MNYDELLTEADNAGIKVKEIPLKTCDGRCRGNRIAIRNNIRLTKRKAEILAEELGHYHTTVGNIIDQSSAGDRKQELTARLWAYNKQIGLSGLINGYKRRCQNHTELADFLGVTEEFLCEALECYRKKYGVYTEIDNYIIMFEPCLGVIERF